MAVTSINNASANPLSTRNSSQAPASSSLSMDSFMKLLSVQLQNQDINNPMSNAEMMQQLTSMATVQSMNTFSELSSTQYALNLIGQTVQVAATDEVTQKLTTKEGKVTGINLSNMSVYLEGDTEGYGLGNIMEVGVVPKKDDKKPGTGTGGADDGNNNSGNENNPNGPGGTGGTGGTGGDGNSGKTTKSRSVEGSASVQTFPSEMPQDKRDAINASQGIPEDKKAALAAARSSTQDKLGATAQTSSSSSNRVGPGGRTSSNPRDSVTGPGVKR